MQDYQNFSHNRWDCKYHVVFIPKKRKKRIVGRYDSIPGRFSGSWRNRKSRRSSKDS